MCSAESPEVLRDPPRHTRARNGLGRSDNVLRTAVDEAFEQYRAIPVPGAQRSPAARHGVAVSST